MIIFYTAASAVKLFKRDVYNSYGYQYQALKSIRIVKILIIIIK